MKYKKQTAVRDSTKGSGKPSEIKRFAKSFYKSAIYAGGQYILLLFLY